MIKNINNIDPKLLEEDERIVSFLKGQMSAEEESKFMTELNENPELKEKAIVTARLVKGLKEVGSMRDRDIIGAFLASSEQCVNYVAKDASRIAKNMKYAANETLQIEEAAYVINTSANHTEYMPSDVPAASHANVAPTRRAAKWLSVAASLIFIVWLGIDYIQYRTTTGLGEQYGNEFESGMIVRGTEGQSEASKKLENLFADVKQDKNLDDAIHELSLCWEVSQMETYNDYTDYSAEIGWNLAIAYLKDNDRKSAKKVLEKLIETSEKGSAVSKKAKELLEKLK